MHNLVTVSISRGAAGTTSRRRWRKDRTGFDLKDITWLTEF
jgi:hypothetical protein